MTALERALLTALVDAAFWQHVGQPEMMPTARIQYLSHELHYRAAKGQARTISKPSKLNR